jgi:hypothetical protein
MRIGLGTALLLAATSLVGLTSSPVGAAADCEAADTTWQGPADEGASASWDEPGNWSDGVPDATRNVCIPLSVTAHPVVDGPEAEAGVVTLAGMLTVETGLTVAGLTGENGDLHGPGTTTVTEDITGSMLTLLGSAVVDLPPDAVVNVDADVAIWDSSLLTVRGNAVLGDGATVDSLGGRPFTVTETGSLTLAGADASASIMGGFANHGEVTVAATQRLLMSGASPEHAHADQYSTGNFTGSPDSTFNVANTKLRSGAFLNHLAWVDHITVPADETVTVADSTLYWDPAEPEPNLGGAGELRLTDTAVVGGRIGGALTVTVPAGEVARMGDAVVQGEVRIRVDGELQGADIYLNDSAVLDVFGVHRVLGGSGVVDFTGTDPGVEIINPGGQLLANPDGGLVVLAPFVNEGTVDSGAGQIYLGPRVESPSPSSGTFRADPTGALLLGSNVEGEPPVVLDDPAIEGTVQFSGQVLANSPQLRGHLGTLPGGANIRSGQLTLSGTTTLTDGASISGNVTVNGALEADPGATGTATLSGADVAGSVRAASGTLSIPSLAPSTLADGTLAGGEWSAAPDATLALPTITTNDAGLTLEGPGASFGDGLATLTGTGPNGTLALLDGVDFAITGLFRNEGTLELSSGSRLDVGGKYRQLATGTLMTHLDAAGLGRIRAVGRRDLDGRLVVDRDLSYVPSVDTRWTLLTSNGRAGRDDRFERVVSPRYGERRVRKIRPLYELDRVRLQVDRFG